MNGNKSWVKNQRTIVDGYNFPSKLHAAVYGILKILERAGKLSNIRHEVSIQIVGKLKWKADFVAFDEEKQKDVVHEAKGFMNDRFKAIMQAWDGHGPMDLNIWSGSYVRPTIIKTIYGKE